MASAAVVNEQVMDVQGVAATEYKKGQIVKWSTTTDYTVIPIADDADQGIGVVKNGKAANEVKSILIAVWCGAVHVSQADGAIARGGAIAASQAAGKLNRVKAAASGERQYGYAVASSADGKAVYWHDVQGLGLAS